MLSKLIGNIAEALDKNNIAYMIIGGQAVLIYGEPRLTKDIDITLGVGVEKLDKVISIAKDLKFDFLVENPDQFVKKNMVLPAIDRVSGFRIDFIFSFTDYEKKAIERANVIIIGNKKVRFASVEDIVIHKLFAGRPRDIEDLKNILRKSGGVDYEYVINWLKIFDSSNEEKLLYKFQNLLSEIE